LGMNIVTFWAMLTNIFCLALASNICWQINAHTDQVTLSSIRLLQNTIIVVARSRVAQLTNIMIDAGSALLPEQELICWINDAFSFEVPVLYGACFPGLDEVAEMDHVIASEVVCFICSFLSFVGL
jgi:hypothetical protein